MKKLAAVCIQRPVFAAMLILCLVVVGAASYSGWASTASRPSTCPPSSCARMLPGASPEEVEVLVSPAHRRGRQHRRGHRRAALGLRRRQLDRHRDVQARSRHRGRRRRTSATASRRSSRELPRDVRPPVVTKFDNDRSPVLTIAVSANRPLRELTEIADKIVKPQLERSGGVGEVEIVGGLERAINVWVDADRLAAYQLPITAVRDALARQNADVPGGNVTGATREQTLRTMGRMVDPRAFNDLVIATRNGVADPRARHRLRRGRHEGAAVDCRA